MGLAQHDTIANGTTWHDLSKQTGTTRHEDGWHEAKRARPAWHGPFDTSSAEQLPPLSFSLVSPNHSPFSISLFKIRTVQNMFGRSRSPITRPTPKKFSGKRNAFVAISKYQIYVLTSWYWITPINIMFSFHNKIFVIEICYFLFSLIQ